ncbi:MAG: response regulator [Sandaracinaceae bacterium]
MSAAAPVILVIDDDEALLRLVELAFRSTRARVVTHARGYGALALIGSERPDVVILDAMMPGLDGPSVLELVRADGELRTTRVVLWSALPKDQLAERAERGGADGYLEKTVGARQLVDQVAHWLLTWDGVAIR